MDKTAKELVEDKIVNIKDIEFPLISFVMPVYNDGNSVEKAIDSIFDQDWPNIEVIAVNDGSPDNSKEVLSKLSKKHKRLTVVNFERNRGACEARNEGAKLAKGKYLAWLPADAKIYPGVVRVWVETLEKYPDYDFLYGGYRFITDTGEVYSNYFSDTFDPVSLEWANYIDGSFPIKTETYWRVANIMGQPNGLWDPNIKSLQDWDFWLSVVKEGKGKGLYYKDIFFETTLPHAGGLSDDSHRNWLARTRAIKAKHGIKERKICVTAPGAPFFAKYIAYLLDADFQHNPALKQHDYDIIYELGFYPSIAEACQMVFCDPNSMSQYEELLKRRIPVPLAPAVKIVHLIGTDIYQMQTALNTLDLKVFQAVLNGQIDYLFTEYKETQKEVKELGISSEILALPPRKFFETTPFPKDFTVAVYAPEINRGLYNYDLMVKVAKALPHIKFKFFGNPKEQKIDGNIEYVGYVMDMTKLIAECSCLMRITTHDGLPQSVLEFLSAGRRVIFNHDFPNVNTANKQIDEKALIKALKEESTKGLDLEVAKWIRKEFSHEKFKKKIYSLLNYNAKTFWERNSNRWLKLAKNFYGTKDWDEIEPFVKKVNPKSVIDVGCGEGQWSEKFDCRYLGIDIASKLIASAIKKYPDKRFATSSLEELADKPFAEKYDLAFCYTVFEHIVEENMPQAVKALKKVAKKAIIIEPQNIKTKYYCHNHNYNQWFKIKEKKQLGNRVLMLVDLA